MRSDNLTLPCLIIWGGTSEGMFFSGECSPGPWQVAGSDHSFGIWKS